MLEANSIVLVASSSEKLFSEEFSVESFKRDSPSSIRKVKTRLFYLLM